MTNTISRTSKVYTAGFIVAAFIVAGFIVAGFIVAGFIVTGYIVTGFVVAGFIMASVYVEELPNKRPLFTATILNSKEDHIFTE